MWRTFTECAHTLNKVHTPSESFERRRYQQMDYGGVAILQCHLQQQTTMLVFGKVLQTTTGR
jgi:hypothetical protein